MTVHIVHPYILHSDFVGRSDELLMIADWYCDSNRPILFIDAIGGTGKSALAWVWLHYWLLRRPLDARVDHTPSSLPAPLGVLWWSFYATNAKFRDFLDVLKTFISDPSIMTADGDELIRLLVQELSERKYLLVLDGMERALAAYDRPDAVHEF